MILDFLLSDYYWLPVGLTSVIILFIKLNHSTKDLPECGHRDAVIKVVSSIAIGFLWPFLVLEFVWYLFMKYIKSVGQRFSTCWYDPELMGYKDEVNYG